MFDLFSSKKQQAIKLVDDYIQRNPCEFLNPTKTLDNDIKQEYKTVEDCWNDLLTLNKRTFMQGWKPITKQYDTMYDQLFYYYFEYPIETEKQISLITKYRPLTWFPPQWFERSQPLPSGRMGQVYLTECRLPYTTKRLVVREINLCMITQGNPQFCLPKQVIGITAARTKQNHRKLALVAIAADATLEQWIPQVDQWTFQKTFRTALAVASAVRDFHQKDKIHPNLQPRNIFITQNEPMVSLVDDWPTLPLSSRYGRYPYVAPEICHDSASVSQASNVYSLGVILWQLASGVIFPSFAPLCKDVYAFTFPNHIDSAYVAVIKRCLARSPANRPTADQVCEALVRTLMADMACPASRQWIQLHALEIRDRQSQLAKYLAMHHAKRDLHDLMRGASISKRMMLQVQASFERHWHNKATSSQTVHPAPPPPSRRISVSETQRKKKRHIYKTNKNDCCNNIYGAELPDLMQMGFA